LTVTATFQLSLLGGALGRHHRRWVGDLERLLPWTSLDPRALAPEVRAAAARRWTENAFNEHRSAILMAHLLQVLGEAQVPLDLHSLACRFPAQELAHAEICGRLAAHLGEAGPVGTATLATSIPLAAGLTTTERCNELVVRLCCVAETLSKAWLESVRARARQPLIRAVLSHLLRDEAIHSRFGWLYLDWAQEEGWLEHAEAERLWGIADEALRALEPAPSPWPAEAEEDRPDVLVTLRDSDYRALFRAFERDVRTRLESYRRQAPLTAVRAGLTDSPAVAGGGA
jgi:hypothetical protein